MINTIEELLSKIKSLPARWRRIRACIYGALATFIIMFSYGLYQSGYLQNILILIGWFSFSIACSVITWKISHDGINKTLSHLISRAIEKLKQFIDWLRSQIISLDEVDPNNLTLDELLLMANEEELSNLAKILGSNERAPEKLGKYLRRKATRELNYWLKDTLATYEDAVNIVCIKCDISDSDQRDLNIPEKELRILQYTFDRMPEDKRNELNKVIAAQYKSEGRSLKGEASVAGGIILAQASGFGVYMMASSVLASVTSALGISLPFAAFTGLSKAVSILIGPIGWTALGGWTLYKINSPNIKKLLPSVLMVAAIRARLNWERERQYDEYSTKINIAIQANNLLSQLAKMPSKKALSTIENDQTIQLLLEDRS